MKNSQRLELFRKKIPEYRRDPVLFGREILKFEPEPYQKELLMDLACSPKVSIKSGHGIGKTASEAVAALWFLSCFPYARVVATAPTAQQLNDVLWAELNKWIGKSEVLPVILHWTKTYVYVDGYERRWFAVAKTAGKPENMQGFHEDNMLFIVDEASGVEDEIMEAVLATLSGDNNKLLMCGNPTRTTGTFYDSHTRDRALYKCHTVSSLDSKRTNKENIEMFKRKYGEDSNVYKVRVLGEFPTQEDDVFIPLPLVEHAINNELPDEVCKISLGVDVARFGDDETIIAQNVSGKISLPVIAHGQDLMKTVGNIVITYRNLIKQYKDYKGIITAYIDDTGLGGGVTDRLEEVKREEHLTRLEVVPINFGMKPPQDGSELKYSDISTYMWGNVKTLLETNQLQLENDEELVAQLSVRKYTITSSGKLELERKKDMKERGIKSPDRGDAVALSCFSTNKIYNAFIEAQETIVIPKGLVLIDNSSLVNIGIVTTGTIAIVATAILGDDDRVVVLKSVLHKGGTDLDTICNHFLDFAKMVKEQYGRIDYVYCGDDEYVTTKAIKNAVMEENIECVVRNSTKMAETDRIRLTTKLMKQNRLFVTEECESLSRAFNTAIWTNKRNVDKRDETSDVNTLKAFECTIEREASRLLAKEKEGE